MAAHVGRVRRCSVSETVNLCRPCQIEIKSTSAILRGRICQPFDGCRRQLVLSCLSGVATRGLIRRLLRSEYR